MGVGIIRFANESFEQRAMDQGIGFLRKLFTFFNIRS